MFRDLFTSTPDLFKKALRKKFADENNQPKLDLTLFARAIFKHLGINDDATIVHAVMPEALINFEAKNIKLRDWHTFINFLTNNIPENELIFDRVILAATRNAATSETRLQHPMVAINVNAAYKNILPELFTDAIEPSPYCHLI